MPEFVNLSTTHATTRPEVDPSRTASRAPEFEADVGAQVMVTVECHEMVDIEDGDGDVDTKWDRDPTESGGRVGSARKVRDMV